MGEAARVRTDGFRRWFHRNERRLIVLWLVLLVALNLLPFAWHAADRAWKVENRLVRAYRWYWAQRLRVAEAKGRESRVAELAELEDLLHDMGPRQLRSAVGRLRQEVLLRVSGLKLAMGDRHGAMEAAREMAAVDPRDHRGWVALGEARWALGDRGGAVEAFRRALAIDPDLEPAVARLVEFHVAEREPEAAVAAFQAYREALWQTRVLLYYTARWPDFDPSWRLTIPVTVDGKLHVWRHHPRHPRGSGEAHFPELDRIDGLRLVVADTAAVPSGDLRLRMMRTGSGREVLEGRPALEWEPVRVDADILPGVWVATERWEGWQGRVDLQDLREVATVELELTLAKPVGPALARNLRRALEALGREAELSGLLEGMQVERVPVTLAVAGHVRRGPEDDPPLLPALVEALPEIAGGSDALVLTGDVVWEGTPDRWDRFGELVVSRAGIPVWIAPGNHDLHDGRPGAARPRFLERFGPTWSSHRLGSTLVLVLDTEAVPGDVRGEQLAFALDEVERARRSPGITSLAVFLHRVLWFLGDERFESVATRANASSRPGAGEPREFMRRLLPALRAFAADRGPVVVTAGDVGTRIPLVYHREGRLTLVASGNRAQDPPAWWNHWLRIRLDGDEVTLEAVPLGGAPLGNVERYTVEFWDRHPGGLRPPAGRAR